MARVKDFSWTETAIDASRVDAVAPSPDFVEGSPGSGLAIATVGDTLRMVEGVVEQRDGPVAPVIYLPRIDTSGPTTQTINGTRNSLYGRLTNDLNREQVVGDERRTEVERLNTVSIQEIR